MINFSIADELSKVMDLSRTVPGLTVSFIAASGVLLLVAAIAMGVLAKKYTDIRFFPVIYGVTAYLVFYVFIGGFINSYAGAMAAGMGKANIVVVQLLMVVVTNALLIGGRFFAQWFIKKYYPKYGDCVGIGFGCGVTEAMVNGASILFNYSLAQTINSTGLAALANSYASYEEAYAQLSEVEVLFTTPWYEYLVAGVEAIYFLVFHVMISVLFYAVFNKDVKPVNVLVILGFYCLIALPSTLYNCTGLFGSIGCFLVETVIFAGSVFFFIRTHMRFYKDLDTSYKPKQRPGAFSRPGTATNGKMPKFNDRINKL